LMSAIGILRQRDSKRERLHVSFPVEVLHEAHRGMRQIDGPVLVEPTCAYRTDTPEGIARQLFIHRQRDRATDAGAAFAFVNVALLDGNGVCHLVSSLQSKGERLNLFLVIEGPNELDRPWRQIAGTTSPADAGCSQANAPGTVARVLFIHSQCDGAGAAGVPFAPVDMRLFNTDC
jgi:hypothetical protein